MSTNSVDPFWVSSDQNVCLLIGCNSGFRCFDRKVDDIADYEDPFSFLFVVGSLKETHDFFGDAEMSMAEHFGGSSDMEVNFIKILDLFSTLESNSISFCFRDSLLEKLFLHISLKYLIQNYNSYLFQKLSLLMNKYKSITKNKCSFYAIWYVISIIMAFLSSEWKLLHFGMKMVGIEESLFCFVRLWLWERGLIGKLFFSEASSIQIAADVSLTTHTQHFFFVAKL